MEKMGKKNTENTENGKRKWKSAHPWSASGLLSGTFWNLQELVERDARNFLESSGSGRDGTF
jgi:hypothetical protein